MMWSAFPRAASLLKALMPVFFLLIVLAVWHVVIVLNDVKPFMAPSPLAVGQAMLDQFPKLAHATWVTALAAISGYLASLAIGTIIAFVFSQSRIIRTSCYPYAILLQTVPIVAVAPLIIAWFGNGFQSVVIVSAIISLFPVLTNATTGMLTVDPNLLDLFRLHGASRWQTWMHLRLPSAVPYIITGARTSSGLAIIGAIIGEFFVGYGTKHFGLGYLIQQTTKFMKTDELFAAMIASTLLGVTMFGGMTLLSRTILSRWFEADS